MTTLARGYIVGVNIRPISSAAAIGWASTCRAALIARILVRPGERAPAQQVDQCRQPEDDRHVRERLGREAGVPLAQRLARRWPRTRATACAVPGLPPPLRKACHNGGLSRCSRALRASSAACAIALSTSLTSTCSRDTRSCGANSSSKRVLKRGASARDVGEHCARALLQRRGQRLFSRSPRGSRSNRRPWRRGPAVPAPAPPAAPAGCLPRVELRAAAQPALAHVLEVAQAQLVETPGVALARFFQQLSRSGSAPLMSRKPDVGLQPVLERTQMRGGRFGPGGYLRRRDRGRRRVRLGLRGRGCACGRVRRRTAAAASHATTMTSGPQIGACRPAQNRRAARLKGRSADGSAGSRPRTCECR